MPRTALVPAYRLHRPSGQARVITRGKRHYPGARGSSESREKHTPTCLRLVWFLGG